MNKVTTKEIDLIIIKEIIQNNFKKIFRFVGVVFIFAIAYCLIATPIFTASVIINPPKLSDSGSGLSSILGGTMSIIGVTGSAMLKTDQDMSMAILKTREVQDQLIAKFNLIKYYKAKNIENARDILSKKTDIKSDMKTGFLTIAVNDSSPQLACKIANYYTVALGNLISRIGFDQAANRRKFFQEQAEIAKHQLLIAQNNLTNFAKEHGVTGGLQTNIITGISTQLQAQLAASQSQLRTMQSYTTQNNPDYIRLKEQISSLKLQILEMNGVGDNIEDNSIPSNLAPELSEKYKGLIIEFTFREEVYKIILRQYEVSRLDEVSDSKPLSIQVIDNAVIPLHKSAPKRLLIIIISIILSLVFASLYYIFMNYSKYSNKN